MKRLAIAILIALVACAAVFAATEPVIRYDDNPDYPINFAFQPTLARYNAMGQSGLALPFRVDSFYTNPAALGNGGFAIAIPSATFTLYNISRLVNDEQAMDAIQNLASGAEDDSAAMTVLSKMLQNLGYGHNLLATADANMALQIGYVGLGTNFQLKLHGVNEASTVATQKIVPEINLAQTLGFGIRLIDEEAISLSVGASAHAIYKVYMKGIDAEKVSEMMDSGDYEKTLLWETPAMAGYAFPIDLGVNLGFFDNQIVLSATANNLNGKYYMNSYTSAGDWANSLSEDAVEAPELHVANESQEFQIETPWTLNFGVALAPKVFLLNPTVTVDLVDMIDLVKSFGSESFRASDLLLHMNVGAELGVFDIATLRAGVNRGYWSLGAGINLPFMQIDAAYGWQEFGLELGDKPVDSFSIRCSLGFDRKSK